MGWKHLWYDCSGLIQSIYKMVEINFRRDTSDQIEDSRFASISVNDAQNIGDIVFFDFEGNGVDHVEFGMGMIWLFIVVDRSKFNLFMMTLVKSFWII